MYKTVRELHIGLDIALQSIDTNRKLVFKPYEKDWVLNEVMFQEILSMTNALKANRHFEDRIAYVNALQSLKAYPKTLQMFKTDTDNEVFAVLPADCLTPITSRATILPKPFKKDIGLDSTTSYKVAYSVVPLLKAATLADYKLLKIKFGDTDILFDLTNKRKFTDLKALFPIDDMNKDETRYVLIPLVLEYINRHLKGVEVYWEKFLDVYQPDCFIMVVKPDEFDTTKTSSNGTRKFDIATTKITTSVNTTSQICDFVYYDVTSIVGASTQRRKDIPNRIVSNEEVFKIDDNVFARSNGESTASVIDSGRIRLFTNDSFTVEKLRLEYYRKPVLINHKTGVTCEINDEFFLINLVNKAALKLSARIQDENYPLISRESVIIN